MSPDHPSPDPFRFDAEDAPRSPLRRLVRTDDAAQRRLLIAGIAASTLAPIFGILPPVFVQFALDQVLLGAPSPGGAVLPTGVIPADRLTQLWVAAVLVLGATGNAALVSAIGTLAWGRFAQAAQHELRIQTVARLQARELAFFKTNQNGQLLSILSNDIDELDRLIQHGGKQAIETVVRLVGIAVLLAVLHWQLAIVALLVVPVLGIASRWYHARIRPVYRATRQTLGALNARVDNTLQGILTVKAYAGEDVETERIAGASRDVFGAKWQGTVLRGTFFPAAGLLNAGGFVLLLVVGGYWIVAGPPGPFTRSLSVGTLVAFLMYNEQIRDPLVHAGGVLDAYLEAQASLRRIYALTDARTREGDRERAAAVAVSEGRIDVSDATYSYKPDGNPVLAGISASIDACSFVGVVGPTGSGKTTLAHLLIGLLTPIDGTVRLDGTALAEYDPAVLRASVALVPQDPYLFTGTVAANVSYGRPDATRGDVEAALATAEALEFVRDLEEGLDTVVGQGGVTLSGGQRQRLAIARAILADPAVLVLDEATSDVDARTESWLRDRFRELTRTRTVIAITHRLGTVRRADRLFVLDDGRIVERGTHETLRHEGGLYERLWSEEMGAALDTGDQPADD